MSKLWNGKVRRIEVYKKDVHTLVSSFYADDACCVSPKNVFYLDGKMVYSYDERRCYYKSFRVPLLKETDGKPHTCQCMVLSENQFFELCGVEPHFENGFLSCPKVDWLNMLETFYNMPVVSVRKDSRPDSKDLFVILANGYIKEGIRHLYGSIDHVKNVLTEIFKEAETDEYEVFGQYAFDDLSMDEKKDLDKWLHEVY